MKNKTAQQYMLLVGVRGISPEGKPLIFEVLAGNGDGKSIEAAQQGLISVLLDEGFTQLSAPYTRTATLEELAETQEISGSISEIFTYH